MSDVISPPGSRKVLTENSVYCLWEDRTAVRWGYYVRLPRVGKPSWVPSSRLTYNAPHAVVGWGLVRGLWAPDVLALRLWAPDSAAGVYSSPVESVDGLPVGTIPPPSDMRTGLDVVTLIHSDGYAPDWVEVHGNIPGAPREVGS